MAITNRLRTIRETAAELGLSPNTVRLWISQGRMPHVRLGKTIRVRQSEIEQLIEDGAVPAVETRIGKDCNASIDHSVLSGSTATANAGRNVTLGRLAD